MFERFTERARQAVILSQDEARSLKHNYLGTEHLLLALCRGDKGDAAALALYDALSNANAIADADMPRALVRDGIEEMVGYGSGEAKSSPFTPRAKKVMELALRESLDLGHNYVGTEHLLLGLTREPEGVAARVLSSLEVEPEHLRSLVVGRMAGGIAKGSTTLAGSMPADTETPGAAFASASKGGTGKTRLGQPVAPALARYLRETRAETDAAGARRELTLNLPASDLDRLDAFCARTGAARDTLLRDALRTALDEVEGIDAGEADDGGDDTPERDTPRAG